jgi:hypothetical protein
MPNPTLKTGALEYGGQSCDPPPETEGPAAYGTAAIEIKGS